MRVSIFCVLLGLAIDGASAQTPQRWASMTIGAGGSTSSHGTVYQGTPYVFGRIGYAWTSNRPYAVEIEALGGRDFGAGDCVFTCPPPPMNFLGVSANALWSLGGAVRANRSHVGAGLGAYRVAPTESHRVSPRAAPGISVIAEAPVLTGSVAAATLGLRGLALPFVHGETMYVALLTLGFRRW